MTVTISLLPLLPLLSLTCTGNKTTWRYTAKRKKSIWLIHPKSTQMQLLLVEEKRKRKRGKKRAWARHKVLSRKPQIHTKNAPVISKTNLWCVSLLYCQIFKWIYFLVVLLFFSFFSLSFSPPLTLFLAHSFSLERKSKCIQWLRTSDSSVGMYQCKTHLHQSSLCAERSHCAIVKREASKKDFLSLSLSLSLSHLSNSPLIIMHVTCDSRKEICKNFRHKVF